MILTMLILSAPPMAAAFFNGVLGNFQAFSAFGGRRNPPDFSGQVYRDAVADPPAVGPLMGMHHEYAVPGQAHLDEIKRSPAGHESQASTTVPTLQDIERRIWVELAAQEAEAAGIQLAQVRGGPVRAPTPGISIAENRGWDAALNIAADPLGLLEPYYATKAAMAQAEDAMMKQRVDEFRKGMIDAGVKNVSEGYDRAYFAGGKQGNDYAGTLNKLASQYLDHVQDKRLREMWGDHYKDIRLRKSQMNVLEFEKWVLDAQQKAVDVAYDSGLKAIRTGEITPLDGQYARELGNYIDRQARLNLRLQAKAEGINDSGPSRIWAINRRIQIDTVSGYGIPDNRIGHNLYADTSLAKKTSEWEQVQRWNTIRPGHTIIIRPNQIGGSYVIPRSQILEYTPQAWRK